jgi:hypothetical protein
VHAHRIGDRGPFPGIGVKGAMHDLPVDLNFNRSPRKSQRLMFEALFDFLMGRRLPARVSWSPHACRSPAGGGGAREPGNRRGTGGRGSGLLAVLLGNESEPGSRQVNARPGLVDSPEFNHGYKPLPTPWAGHMPLVELLLTGVIR